LEAVTIGNINMVKLLLDDGRFNVNGYIVEAVKTNNIDIVKLLLDCGGCDRKKFHAL
jgi:hypothetical protein